MKPQVKYYTEHDACNAVGKGWSELIHRVYELQRVMGTSIGIVQVKEKLGGLRIYPDYYTEPLEKIIHEVERESFTVCEQCGVKGGLRKRDNWYFTSCEEHSNGCPLLTGRLW